MKTLTLKTAKQKEREAKYFNTATAKLCERNPQAIGNKVYANRMGNGSELSGDGWRYRGRGFIQLTGKDSYYRLSKYSGVNYVSEPDKLLNEVDSMIAALWFWDVNKINTFSDKGDVLGATKRINGGTNGLSDREVKYKKYLTVFR